jgi:hypothetical protein
MKRLIDNLRSFNSKERFFLIGHILGNTNFTPSQAFKENIEDSLSLKIPDELFAVMDYHLDWLYASLYLTFNGRVDCQIFSNSDHLIKAQQEDVDFIIAFADDVSCHIILVEAKGVTGWTNRQMNSKAMRFEEIFGSDGKRWPGVNPHFLLLSPRRSRHLDVSKWPSWMTTNGEVPWIELPIPTGLKKVTRCSSEGVDDKDGLFWKTSWR